MSGIDRYDQMLSYQSGLRKTARWYKKVGIHIFEFFLSNTFYLHMKNTTRLSSGSYMISKTIYKNKTSS